MRTRLVAMRAGVLAMLLIALGLGPAAHAYPEVVIDLTAHPTVLYGGQSFTARATSNVDCAWTLEWNGVSRSKAASQKFVTAYTAPSVTKVTHIPLHGTCVYALPDGATPVTSRVSARRAAGPLTTWKRTIMITVLPRGSVSPPGGHLPDTGGPGLLVLLLGLGLVGTGTAVMLRGRGRHRR